jgi:hypothetical protein
MGGNIDESIFRAQMNELVGSAELNYAPGWNYGHTKVINHPFFDFSFAG